jgi:hypothetical protein
MGRPVNVRQMAAEVSPGDPTLLDRMIPIEDSSLDNGCDRRGRLVF